MIGQTISHYRILEKLGSGGMGLVFKAEDLKLKRTVALKFLGPHVLGNPDDQERFLREARAAAALSHSSICTIHGIEEVDGRIFIVMEYVPGQSLKEMIAAGPLTIERTLALATQIGSALTQAHQHKIIHRDIKPGNIMVCESDQVKVLDFGLARAPDVTRMTMTGTTLGTVAYMSPEQSQGHEVDQRTDIWSLGVVIYEMVSGKLPFGGDYEQAVIFSSLNDEPEPLSSLRSNVPLDMEAVVDKAMAKDRKHRYQHVDDLLVDLQRISEVGSSKGLSRSSRVVSGVGRQSRRKRPSLWLTLAVLASLILGVISGKVFWPRQEQASAVVKYTIPLHPGHELNPEYHKHLAISRDGTHIVYVARTEADPQLILRTIDQLGDQVLTGTEGATDPFFSPDGEWIGFFAQDKLKKISLVDNTVLTLCDAPWPGGATWGENGIITLAFEAGAGLFQLPATGGNPEPIPYAQIESGPERYRWPFLLPGGKGILATAWTGMSYENTRIVLLSAELDTAEVLMNNGLRPVYVPSGHILFLRGPSLMALPFDLDQGRVSGQPFMVDTQCSSDFAVSANGHFVKTTNVYLQGFEQKHTLVWVDRTGSADTLQVAPGPYYFPVLSPDGGRLGLTIFKEKEVENRILDLDRWVFTRLTESSFDHCPAWSPDGRQIAFSSGGGESPNIFIRSSDGLGESLRLTTSPYHQDPVSWSPDGRILSIVEFKTDSDRDINLIEFTEDGPTVKPFLNSGLDERHPMISPNGRWVVYTSTRDRRPEVYLRPLSGGGQDIQISPKGGSDPLWSPTGSELFFWTWGEVENGKSQRLNTLMSIGIDPSTGRPTRDPEILFQREWVYHESGRPHYDVHPDNRRFIMLEQDLQPPTNLEVTLNWFQRLRSLAQ